MVSNSVYTQSQGRGYFWEDQIRSIFGLAPSGNDTSKHDISLVQEDISVKTTGGKSVGMGDILRIWELDATKKQTLVIVRYKQFSGYKKVEEVIEINFTTEIRDYFFGSLTREELIQYVDLIKSLPKGRCSKSTSDHYKSVKKNLQNTKGMGIVINPKVDSKDQRRVQCSIPDINKLIEFFPDCLVSRCSTALFRGQSFDPIYESNRRKVS
jgi:hypothetical protein